MKVRPEIRGDVCPFEKTANIRQGSVEKAQGIWKGRQLGKRIPQLKILGLFRVSETIWNAVRALIRRTHVKHWNREKRLADI